MSQLVSSDNPLHHWQALFAQGQMRKAIGIYRQALTAAERFLSSDLLPDSAIAAYSISRLNLAEVLDRQDEAEQAATELIGMHVCLIEISLGATRDQAWLEAALCHSRRTQLELQHFLSTHEHPGIASLLQASHPPAPHLN